MLKDTLSLTNQSTVVARLGITYMPTTSKSASIPPNSQNLARRLTSRKLGGSPQESDEKAISDRPLVVSPNIGDCSYSLQQLASQHRPVVAKKATTEKA